MKENIRFRGLSFDKDEQSAAHGELSLCAGVELHDGALRPSVLEGTKVQHEGTDSELTGTLLYVHETPSYRHYITQNDKTLYWYKKDGTDGTVIKTFAQADGDVISVNSVGNTLLVMTENTGLHYILWKETNYKYLGTQIPFLPIEFGPSEQYRAKYDRSTINSDQVGESFYAWRQMPMIAFNSSDISEGAFNPNDQTRIVTISPNFQAPLTEAVHAIINQSNNMIAKDGHFYAPFMLRYCYRLYDGSMVMHSAPVFMNVIHPLSFKVYCTNISVPDFEENVDTHEITTIENGHIEITNGSDDDTDVTVTYTELDEQGTARSYTFRIEYEHVVLQYIPNNVGIRYHIEPEANENYNAILNSLKGDWSDIVKSVDVFVSAPILREDMGELIKQMVIESPSKGVRRSLLMEYKNTMGIWTNPYMRGGVWYRTRRTNNVMFDIPKLSDEQYWQKICDTSNFYKIASYQLDELEVSDGRSLYTELKYDKSVIPNITAQEQMIDEYHTHNQLVPINGNSGMYVYNHRLNLYGMKEKLFEGFSMYNMINWYAATAENVIKIGDITVELDTEDGKKYVKEQNGRYFFIPHYAITKGLLFYPDSRATKMYIRDVNSTTIVLPMKSLNFLNGAVAVGAFFKENLNDFVTTPAVTPPSVNSIVPLPNRIITSEVDNPFVFPLNGRNAVGIGNVKGIAAVTRALSQGQVGDHDLVVFSTDGIWVLKVSSEGTYMAAHNISREVCSNPRSICQLDQSIVFATQRSLSKFVESDVVSISDVLDGPIPNLADMLPDLARAIEDNTDLSTLLDFSTPAVDMFNQGRVFYDYVSSRIVVLQQNTSNAASVALVFSIRDMAWSTMMVPAIRSVIPGYPSPFVQIGGNGDDAGKVMILDRQYGYSGAIPHAGLIITRTLTFSDTMDIIRGFRQLTDSAQMPLLFFYGSNDQRKWQMIGQTAREFYEYMPGHPFRFFRIAINTSMLPSEEYQQLELEIISKYAKL